MGRGRRLSEEWAGKERAGKGIDKGGGGGESQRRGRGKRFTEEMVGKGSARGGGEEREHQRRGHGRVAAAGGREGNQQWRGWGRGALREGVGRKNAR